MHFEQNYLIVIAFCSNPILVFKIKKATFSVRLTSLLTYYNLRYSKNSCSREFLQLSILENIINMLGK